MHVASRKKKTHKNKYENWSIFSRNKQQIKDAIYKKKDFQQRPIHMKCTTTNYSCSQFNQKRLTIKKIEGEGEKKKSFWFQYAQNYFHPFPVFIYFHKNGKLTSTSIESSVRLQYAQFESNCWQDNWLESDMEQKNKTVFEASKEGLEFMLWPWIFRHKNNIINIVSYRNPFENWISVLAHTLIQQRVYTMVSFPQAPYERHFILLLNILAEKHTKQNKLVWWVWDIIESKKKNCSNKNLHEKKISVLLGCFC